MAIQKLWRTARFAPDRDEAVVEIILRVDGRDYPGDPMTVPVSVEMRGAITAQLNALTGAEPFSVPVTPSDPPSEEPPPEAP